MSDMNEKQWIPVTERMPEMHEESLVDTDGSIYTFRVSDKVLAYTEDGECVLVEYVDEGPYKKVWVEDGGSTDIVTHWMPIPEPPKEVSHV